MTSSAITPEILSRFPDHPIEGRHRVALAWIDPPVTRLLDAGCSYGYATRFYAAKAKQVVGIDLDELHVAVGKAKYPSIEFVCGAVESTPFVSESFDCVVMTDVLEHVPDRKRALNEVYRLLKPGGLAIITTPHKGLFTLFDPYNYGYYLKRYLRPLYTVMYKLARIVKDGKAPTEENPHHGVKHFHFRQRDLLAMLDDSHFAGKYRIERCLRSGLFIEALLLNLEVLLRFVVKDYGTVRKILKPLAWLADKDYGVSYSLLSANIYLKLRKAA